MKLTIGKKYQLSQEYLKTAPVEHESNIVKIISINGKTVTYTDGKKLFTAKVANFVIFATDVDRITGTITPLAVFPQLDLPPDTNPTDPTNTDPVNTDPVTPPTNPPNNNQDPPPGEQDNPYGDNYI